MRIFVPTKRGLVYWLTQTLIWLNVCFYTANVLSVVFQCQPVYKAWMSSDQGKCVDTNLNLVITGSINVISDILILLLPLWTIWHLRMPIRAKVNVSVAFGAGILYAKCANSYGENVTDCSQCQFCGYHAPLLLRPDQPKYGSDLFTPAARHVDVSYLFTHPPCIAHCVSLSLTTTLC